ncbi:MAG: glycosyltransferase family 2 protein [Candidatus Binatia bacterium]
MKSPLVSVGIPVYNGERTIRHALDALLAQTHQHLELVISDNASTDRSGEICQEYAAKDPRVKYFRNPANVGVYANYRRVVALATGEYFMWAAIDDVKPPTVIEACVQAILKNDRGVMAHGIVLVRTTGGGEIVEYPNAVNAMGDSAAARIGIFTRGLEHNAMIYGLYRRKALLQGKLGSHCGQDYLLCLQMCLLGTVEYVPRPMIVCRERKAIASSSPMYPAVPVTVSHLFTANKIHRRKCWTVLLLGSYYLATIGNVPRLERLGAIAAHLAAFVPLYRSRLAKEVLYQLFEPVVWFSVWTWRLAQRWSITFRIARRLQSCLIPKADRAN